MKIPFKCPVCDGTGLVSRPPGVAGDHPTFCSDSSGPWQCRVCTEGLLYVEQDAPAAPELPVSTSTVVLRPLLG